MKIIKKRYIVEEGDNGQLLIKAEKFIQIFMFQYAFNLKTLKRLDCAIDDYLKNILLVEK